jgi:type II secretory pathway pseudopilin PulG
MNLPSSPRQRTTARMAFTLVELLVVIAIIIVLASLLLAAVFKALDLANEASTRTDITQIGAAEQSFQTKFQVNWLPSRIILCKTLANYYVAGSNPPQIKSPLHQDSLDYLSIIWPRLNWGTPHPSPNSQKWTGTPAWVGIDWDFSDALDDIGTPALFVRDAANNPTATTEVVLEGEQCLVFFLGGIPGSGTVNGFSTDQSNPARHRLAFPNLALTNNADDRLPPFFDFKSNRLVSLSQWIFNQGGNPAGFSDFYAYLDGYGKTPYAYFSSYKGANGYNRYYTLLGVSDCQSLGVWPYAQSGVYPGPATQTLPTPVYLNSQSFQIISAGKNSAFGSGTVIITIQQPQGNWIGGPDWAPGTAAAIYPAGSAGNDDIANFYDRLLGVPTQ